MSEALFMLIAGSDTTASAIRVTMLYVMSTPRVYQKLKDEIRTAIREGRASSPITAAESRELPYLQVGPDLQTVESDSNTNGVYRQSYMKVFACDQ